MYLLCVHVQNQFEIRLHVQCMMYYFLTTAKENESDGRRSEADVDCAEQDVGCWSQVWSAR